jgi:hypothetical protein
VSAYVAEYGLTPGQRVCEEKSNEITAIQDLMLQPWDCHPPLRSLGAILVLAPCALAESIRVDTVWAGTKPAPATIPSR